MILIMTLVLFFCKFTSVSALNLGKDIWHSFFYTMNDNSQGNKMCIIEQNIFQTNTRGLTLTKNWVTLACHIDIYDFKGNNSF